jgi:hypothetical protein
LGKKVAKAYLELSHALADMGHPPQCADPLYQEMFFVEPMLPGTPTSAQMRKMRQDEVDAKLICDFCPVKALCAEYATIAHEPYGIWGGTSAADRKAIYAFARASRTESARAV